jgi:adenylate cyclase
VVRANGERYWEAELHRLRGKLLLARGQAEPAVRNEAETCFLRACAVARAQSALSLELRAVTSLSRLYQGQGRQAEARPLLAETCERFTEGLDTPDLQEARALLAELG